MTIDDEPVRMVCYGCGLIFGMDDISDFDNVACPDCAAVDVAGLGDDGALGGD